MAKQRLRLVQRATGDLRHPEVLVVGRYRGKGLEVIGRTVKLRDDQAVAIGKLLKPAGPRLVWHRPDLTPADVEPLPADS